MITGVIQEQIMDTVIHHPVMLNEVLEYLRPSAGMTVIDCTVGTAGHSLAFMERVTPGGRLIGIDRDEESLGIAARRLQAYSGSFDLAYSNFLDIDKVAGSFGVSGAGAILMDLGISTYQLSNPQRGFSFQNDGPLDMRLDRNSYISAYDLVNNLNEDEISSLLRNFGQERWHNRIASLLVRERQKNPISTTRQLSDIVIRAIPGRFRHQRLHPATRTFQAVRIAVNRELEVLGSAVTKAVELLDKGGRICVISFHSLEDRTIKLVFRELASAGKIDIITQKPLTPTSSEVKDNPPSRSAKLRVAERR
ncbi:MAG: 16S rRNA (cytosine(1402)-N(4))-methyltransferase RsmH [Candidatus Omnitrophota bacterium]